MVNTFILNIESFEKSARLLDSKRLGKQRVEAFQILKCLQNLRVLAKLYSIPDYPVNTITPDTKKKEWIYHVMDTFKKSGNYCIHIRLNGTVVYHTSKETAPIRPKSGNKLIYDGNYVKEVRGVREKVISRGPKNNYVLPGERYIGTRGYYYHPFTIRWLGHEESLKCYINAHIKEWIRRGYKNNMKLYNTKEKCIHPVWCKCKADVKQTWDILKNKELERNEKAWYTKQNIF